MDRGGGEPGWVGGDAVPSLGGDLTGRLARWAAEARVDDAARARGRERWLRQAADEDGTFLGVLADLADRGTPVALHTAGGRRHHGHVRAVGADFVALATAGTGDVVVALSAVSTLRTCPGDPPATGDRPTRPGIRLGEVLVGLAAERERVLVVTRDGRDAVAGTVRAVGRDLLVMQVDGDRPGAAYVPLAAVGELVLGPC